MLFNHWSALTFCLLHLIVSTSIGFAADNHTIQIGELTLKEAQPAKHPGFTHQFLKQPHNFLFYDGIIAPCDEPTPRDCQHLIAYLETKNSGEKTLIDHYHPDAGEIRIEAVSFYNIDEDQGQEMIILISRNHHTVDSTGLAYEVNFYDNKLLKHKKQLIKMTHILPQNISTGFEGIVAGEKSEFKLKSIAAIKARLDAQNKPFTD